MVQQTEALEILKKKLSYKDGVLYWAEGTRKAGKVAGYKNKDGYIEINLTISEKNCMKILAHRAIFAIHNNYLPNLIDHIDQNPHNNKLDNLRDANHCLNSINTGLSKSNTSGIKGVNFHLGKWDSYINIKKDGVKKKIHLGRFNNIEDARTAREAAERHYWNDIRATNSPTT